MKQKTVEVIDLNKNVWEYTLEELREILGGFERGYNRNATGEMVHNEILGWVKEGTVKHAFQIGAITKKNVNGKEIYFVKLPEYRDYSLKLRVLGEIISRRSYASEKDLERLTKTREGMFK